MYARVWRGSVIFQERYCALWDNIIHSSFMHFTLSLCVYSIFFRVRFRFIWISSNFAPCFSYSLSLSCAPRSLARSINRPIQLKTIANKNTTNVSFRVYYTFHSFFLSLSFFSFCCLYGPYLLLHPFHLLALFIYLHFLSFSLSLFFIQFLFSLHSFYSHFTFLIDVFFSFYLSSVDSIHAKKIVVVYKKFFGPKRTRYVSSLPQL